jgi:hypothetical protein
MRLPPRRSAGQGIERRNIGVAIPRSPLPPARPPANPANKMYK